MKQEWKETLINSGAEFEEDKLVSFGNPDRERRIPPQGDIICDLSHIGLIAIHGEDATSFLQSQLTNDITHVTETNGQLSAWCTPKGRTIVTFFIHKHADTYYLSLSLSADKLEAVLKRLRMYVMMSKVVLEDASNSLIHFAMAGPRIEANLEACGVTSLPEADYQLTRHDNLTIMRMPGSVPRFEVYGDLSDAQGLWAKLNARAAPVGAESWNYLSIASGIPVVGDASSEAWVPQMLNLHVINGVNFKKGCFPGQEIVARLKYLGKSKRSLYRLEFNTDDVPVIGVLVVAEGETAEAGKIVNAALNPEGKVEVLAVLKIAMVEEKVLHLGDQEGAVAEVLELPYLLEDE